METIALEKAKVAVETDQQVALVKAQENQSIKVIKAEGLKAQIEQISKKNAEQILAEARAYSEAKMAETNAAKESLKIKATNRLEAAQLKGQGVLAEAEAENLQAQNLDAKRKFEQRMKMAEGLQSMIKTNKIILAGENGEQLLGFFKETTELVNLNQNE